MITATEDELRKRLLESLKIITDDVQDLFVDHHIFWEVQKIIKANPKLQQTPGTFNHWMASNFVASAALAVRRQSDQDKDSVSLRRLLEELKLRPDLFSRTYFTSLYKNGPAEHLKKMADHDYDKHVGAGRSELDPVRIQQDIDLLTTKTNQIRHYVNKKLAHYDAKGLKQTVPTFTDLEDTMRSMKELVQKYNLIMRATWIADLLPTFQFDWTEVFRVTWIS
jgi:hypothetical protein